MFAALDLDQAGLAEPSPLCESVLFRYAFVPLRANRMKALDELGLHNRERAAEAVVACHGRIEDGDAFGHSNEAAGLLPLVDGHDCKEGWLSFLSFSATDVGSST